MKTNLPILLALLAAIVAGAAACGPPQRRTDWRTPAPAVRCTTDADCASGGSCVADPADPNGGTCSSVTAPALPGGDGGTAPQGPPGSPLVQPSPSDIHL